MTIAAGGRLIRCDVAACPEPPWSVPPQLFEVSDGAKRAAARVAGWRSVGDHDLCPDHAELLDDDTDLRPLGSL